MDMVIMNLPWYSLVSLYTDPMMLAWHPTSGW